MYWSPYIVAEASRLLMWLWLRRYGRGLTGADRRAHSDIARRWFIFVTAVFRVVEDAPPYEPLWTETPRDPHDRPIWTAAVRARAHMVVTENLRDGPPPGADGFRSWDNVLYVAPDDFVALLDWWDGADEAARDGVTAGATAAHPERGRSVEPPAPVLRLLRAIAERRRDVDPQDHG